MSFLLTCLFIAALLPYLSKMPLAYAMNQQAGGYDNHHPREQAAKLSGFGARAWAAHKNSFESLLVFGLAILAAIVSGHVGAFIKTLAVVHLVSRLVYHYLYLMDLASLRSLVWGIGVLCSLIILGCSIF